MPQLVTFTGTISVPVDEENTLFHSVFPPGGYGSLQHRMKRDCTIKNIQCSLESDKPRDSVLLKMDNTSQENSGNVGFEANPATEFNLEFQATPDGETAIAFAAGEKWHLFFEVRPAHEDPLELRYAISFEIHPPD